MSTARFFIPQPLAQGDLITLSADTRAHLRSLRLRVGETITLFNGEGGQASARLLPPHSRRDMFGAARIESLHATECEAAMTLTLALALIAADRLDWALEKATELGAAQIILLLTERSARLPPERTEQRLAHWRAITQAACEQSGRNRLPALTAPQPLAAWLGQIGTVKDGELRWLASLRAHAASRAQQKPRSALLAIGPEGGWSEEEEALLQRSGFTAVRLGAATLRSETAAVAALTLAAGLDCA